MLGKGQQVWRHASCLQLSWLIMHIPISVHPTPPVLHTRLLSCAGSYCLESKFTIVIFFEAQGHQIQTAVMCSQAAMIALRKCSGLLACMCGWGLLM